VKPVKSPVTLEIIKADGRLDDMILVRNSRLSVQPVSDAEWNIVCQLAGISD
jgi:predicted RNA-binding protein with PUA-like domain